MVAGVRPSRTLSIAVNVCRARSKTSTVFRLTVAERMYSVFGVVSARLNDIHGDREDQSDKGIVCQYA